MAQWLKRLIFGLVILPFVGSNPVANTKFDLRKMPLKFLCIQVGQYSYLNMLVRCTAVAMQ